MPLGGVRGLIGLQIRYGTPDRCRQWQMQIDGEPVPDFQVFSTIDYVLTSRKYKEVGIAKECPDFSPLVLRY